MSYMAKWGPKGFLLSPTKIVALENLKTTITLKSDSDNDTSGTSPTNTRGLLLQPISFSVNYIRAAGTDPRAQLEEWKSLVGQSNLFYIGSKRFVPNPMTLKQVDASNFVFSPKGDMLSVTINISLEEYSDGKTSKLRGNSTKQGASTGSSEKQTALNATASMTDRVRLSPTAMQVSY